MENVTHCELLEKHQLKFLKHQGIDLVFEANNLYLFEIDSIVAEILQNNSSLFALEKKYGRDTVMQAQEKIKLLQEVSKSKINRDSRKRQRRISSLWLNVSHKCNLTCAYCFADCGRYGQTENLMRPDVMERAIDFFQRQIKGPKARIVFFGGEPLLNFSLIKKTVAYAKKAFEAKTIMLRFTLITNGTIMSRKIMDFIRDNNIKVQVSIDAPPEINDRLRYFPSGMGTSAVIHKHVSMLRNVGLNDIAVRGTVTHLNPNVGKLFKYFRNQGYGKISLITVQVNRENTCYLTESDVDIIKKEYCAMAEEIISSLQEGAETDLGPYTRYIDILAKRKKRSYYCGAGFNSVSVTPEGDIYPCHRVIGQEDMRLGSVFDDKLYPNAFSQMVEVPVNDRDECCDCWAKHFCGGGCAAYQFSDDSSGTKYNSMICDLTRVLAENALKIYYTLYS